MKVTTTEFKQKLFGEVLAYARNSAPVTLTTRHQEDLVVIKKSDLDAITDSHNQIQIGE